MKNIMVKILFCASVLIWSPAKTSAQTLLSNMPNPNGDIYSILKVDSMIYFGGFFTSVDSTAHTGIACFNATTGALSNWNPIMTGNGVTTLTRIGNKLVAGGSFTAINGQTRYGICIFDLTT